ncbi:hypothetical protein H4R35_004139 [Dimargaris xerosporica]|nr:hypothetical protein H4R35_004139 [Dimargaris xerosporica]
MAVRGTVAYLPEHLESKVLTSICLSLLTLVLWHNLYMASRSIQYRRQVLYVICWVMNLVLTVIATVMLLRDYLHMSCRVYSSFMFALHMATLAGAGSILLIKGYYVSELSKLFLYSTTLFYGFTIAAHIYAISQITFTTIGDGLLCDMTLESTSFVIALASDFVFNAIVSLTFLVRIYRANRFMHSGLYRILFRDGMFYWVSTAVFPVVLAIGVFVTAINAAYMTIFLIYSKCSKTQVE